MTITQRNCNETSYANHSSTFLIKEKTFVYQYAPLYAERLKTMRSAVEAAARRKWPDHPLKNLVDLETNEKCVIIGTLYKEMKNKPNILREFVDDETNALPVQPLVHGEKYTDAESDQLILEDELQRILLIDSAAHRVVSSGTLCTGLVAAFLGVENEASKFEVEDVCFKETCFSETTTTKALSNRSEQHSKYVAFVSGLELGGERSSENMFKVQLFVDLMRGDFAPPGVMSSLLANTVRLVVAGNSLSAATQSRDMHNKAKYLTKNFVAGSVSAVKELDALVAQLIDKIEVDVMPGEYDPSNLMLPQQPLHAAIFPRAKSTPASAAHFHTTTNPYRFTLHDVDFLGVSGQSIDDIWRSTAHHSSIDIMKLTLDAGHIAPTCPDTLACYPYYGKDPFILSHLPHVYFAGNQAEFKSDTFVNRAGNQCKMISLPKFSTRPACVFLDLDTLDAFEVAF